MSLRLQNEPEITALLVAPDRDLAGKFLATLPQTHAFQILADLKSYPQAQTLEIRMRQLKPAVILLDLASDPSQALDLVRFVSSMPAAVLVVGLHTNNDSQAILQSLRAGASEFLYVPFDLATQREAVSRLRRMVQPEVAPESDAGHLIAFCSSKPGSGASTIATQTAFALHKATGKRVLLADCDLTGGTIGFYLKLTHNYSVMDALQHAEHLDPALWSSLTVNYGGVDILPAPATPYADALDAARLRVLAEQARWMYDWVILDLPTVFSRNSLLVASECERVFVVSTAELPSLHLTRKALSMVERLGFTRDRFLVLVNRVDKRDDISAADMEKLFGCPVHASLPNDYFALHRVVTLGQPLGPEGDLGRAIESIAQRLTAALDGVKKGPAPARDLRPAYAGQT
jgi:pilus assembly protein CpaE